MRAARDFPREGDRRDSEGRQLLKMLGSLTPGDVVTVTRIDRLARSTFDLFGIIKRASRTPRRNSNHLPSRGPTPAQDRAADDGRSSAGWRTWSGS
jgi:hypothetical protein